ncbi:50S ribosomal protein L32e [Candidatus Micrarchaeota archaeon]|nr:50S ribosomal protein L32e [Candidatus Micrarchaeota archaeon]
MESEPVSKTSAKPPGQPKKVAKKVPRFVRQNSALKKRVRQPWRYPRGIDNKQRMQMRGTGVMPSIGYRTPRAQRHMHPSGVFERLVQNVGELQAASKSAGMAVRIGGGVGKRKRTEIRILARKLGVKVLN